MSYTPLSTAELSRYFTRIGYNGAPRADLRTLSELHALHPLTIPFENLDSWCGRTPVLDEAAVFAKLVDAGRGGYCFEQNLLFLRVLMTLGFSAQTLAARVIVPALQTARTHKVLLVDLAQNRYLVDVGFGGMTMTAPLLLSAQGEQATPHEPWQMEQTGNEYQVSAKVRSEWSAKFRFSLEPQTPKDYEMANWFVATHPASIFVNDLIAARVTDTGRHALLNTRLVFHPNNAGSQQIDLANASQHSDLDSPAAVLQTLQQVFGINTNTVEGLEQRITTLFAAS